MYKVIEFHDSTDGGHCYSSRVGEEEDDIVLTIECQEIDVTKADVRKMRRLLNAVLKEAT
jgi:hypothetical protein